MLHLSHWHGSRTIDLAPEAKCGSHFIVVKGRLILDLTHFLLDCLELLHLGKMNGET